MVVAAATKPIFSESPLLQLLRQSMRGYRVGSWAGSSKSFTLRIPQRFSLISNPEESLDVIYTLIGISRKRRLREIRFDHSDCIELDMGASIILDVVALEIRDEWQRNGLHARFKGIFPKDLKTRERFICTGLYRSLGLHIQKKLLENYEIFPLFTGRRPTGDQSEGGSDQVKAAEKLAEHISTCLGAADYMLSDEGKQLIAEWAGEIIDNAEDHSGQPQWYVMAHMDKSVEGVEGECHLAILGFGKSIYESLNDPTTPDMTKASFRSLAAKHMPFFSAGLRYSEPDLWTMYALQERVSRYNGRDGYVDRGAGTVTMIEAFQGFGRSHMEEQKTLMSLISGSSRILFDGQYSLKPVISETGEKHKVIAFNRQESLEERPDPNCVHSIRNFFPGTVINFKFFIDGVFLEDAQP